MNPQKLDSLYGHLLRSLVDASSHVQLGQLSDQLYGRCLDLGPDYYLAMLCIKHLSAQ